MRAGVLDAVSTLLMEVGYEGLTVEDVAERAGVHKTTVYRRWPTKPELVFEAIGVQSQSDVPVPDTGSLHGDLQAFVRSIAANIGTEGGARRARSLVVAALTSEQLASGMGAFWAERFAKANVIVERAIDRGDLPPGADPTLIIETLIGPLWVRLLLTGEPITERLADEVAGLVAHAVTTAATGP